MEGAENIRMKACRSIESDFFLHSSDTFPLKEHPCELTAGWQLLVLNKCQLQCSKEAGFV